MFFRYRFKEKRAMICPLHVYSLVVIILPPFIVFGEPGTDQGGMVRAPAAAAAAAACSITATVWPSPAPLGPHSPHEVRCQAVEAAENETLTKALLYEGGAGAGSSEGKQQQQQQQHPLLKYGPGRQNAWGPRAGPELRARATHTLWVKSAGAAGQGAVVRVGLSLGDTRCSDHRAAYRCAMTCGGAQLAADVTVDVLDQPVMTHQMTSSLGDQVQLQDPTAVTFKCRAVPGMQDRRFRWFLFNMQTGKREEVSDVSTHASAKSNRTGCPSVSSSLTLTLLPPIKSQKVPELVVICRLDYGPVDQMHLCTSPDSQFCSVSRAFAARYVRPKIEENAVMSMIILGFFIVAVIILICRTGVKSEQRGTTLQPRLSEGSIYHNAPSGHFRPSTTSLPRLQVSEVAGTRRESPETVTALNYIGKKADEDLSLAAQAIQNAIDLIIACDIKRGELAKPSMIVLSPPSSSTLTLQQPESSSSSTVAEPSSASPSASIEEKISKPKKGVSTVSTNSEAGLESIIIQGNVFPTLSKMVRVTADEELPTASSTSIEKKSFFTLPAFIMRSKKEDQY